MYNLRTFNWCFANKVALKKRKAVWAQSVASDEHIKLSKDYVQFKCTFVMFFDLR